MAASIAALLLQQYGLDRAGVETGGSNEGAPAGRAPQRSSSMSMSAAK